MTTQPIVTIPAELQPMIDTGALVVINDSGGKDSQALRIMLQTVIPANQLLVIHASLGDVEWPGALEHARDNAARYSLPFIVARATKSFFDMVEHRYQVRPDAPSWPSAANRQCTSDLKRGPIEREIRRYAKARGITQIINCMGIRAEESTNRSKLAPVKRNEPQSIAGRTWLDWLPIHGFTLDQVKQVVTSAGEQLHYAYGTGNERLSCQFCIMGSANDLTNAAKQNPDLYRRYVELERKTGYSMHMSRKFLPMITGIK